MHLIFVKYLSLLVLPGLIQAQNQTIPTAETRNNTYNATYGPINPSSAESRIARANLSDELSDAVLVAANFERSNWAASSTQLDPFYVDVPSNASNAPPGSVLKVEQYTNTSFYTLPPNVALSRFLFTTKTLNGTTIPASAYVLWPWFPRRFDNISGLPVIAWGHGTSGFSGECGPSHIRNLWYQYSAPFILALQGYVVVAPDYAGLGLDRDANGTFIPHQYLAHPAAGNDIIYSVQAARKAWPSLSKEFVVMGHSQGGGAAWGAAQLLAQDPGEGYLGTVAGSPSTTIQASIENVISKPASVGSYLARVATGLNSVFPSFNYSDWLTPKGVTTTELMQDLQGCQSVQLELLAQQDLFRQDWNSSWYFSTFNKLTANGGKAFAGPMLVVQGTADGAVNVTKTNNAVNATCDAFPDKSLQYEVFEGVSHVPVLYASQQIWLGWIADRFNGVPAIKGCRSQLHHPELAVSAYQKEVALFLQYPLYPYETA